MSKLLGYYGSATLSHLAPKVADIEKKLRELLLRDDSLSYEYTGRERDFVFITGYNDEERDLSPFEHPMMVDGVMNRKYIVVDLRKYVKQLNDKPSILKDVITNSSGALFQINRAILLDMSLAEDSYKLQIVQDNIALIFSNLISSVTNSIVNLNPKEKLLVEGTAYAYIISMFNSELNNDEMRNYLKPILKKAKLTLPLNVDEVDSILSLNITAKSFMECFENIKKIVGPKSVSLQLKSFYNNISSFWFGPGAVETLMLAFEDRATIIALFLTAFNDASFKKSRLSTNIENVKRKIDKETFKKIELRLKEYSVY